METVSQRRVQGRRGRRRQASPAPSAQRSQPPPDADRAQDAGGVGGQTVADSTGSRRRPADNSPEPRPATRPRRGAAGAANSGAGATGDGLQQQQQQRRQQLEGQAAGAQRQAAVVAPYLQREDQQQTDPEPGLAALRQLLANPAEAQQALDHRDGPLHWAIAHGRTELLRPLLLAGAHVDRRDGQHSCTPLVEAARHGSAEAVRALLDSGAEVDAQDVHRCSALMFSALRGHTAMVQLLLDAGADVQLADQSDFSALSYAARAGHADAVHLLLQHGAAPSIHALVQAVWHKHTAIVRSLLRAGALLDGVSPCWVPDIVSLLDKACQELEQRPGPSAAAANGGHAAIVRALVRTGSYPALGELSPEMLRQIVQLLEQACQELEQQGTSPPARAAAATDSNHAAIVCALARVCGRQALESLPKEMLVDIVLLLRNQEQQAAPAPAAQQGTAAVAAGQ